MNNKSKWDSLTLKEKSEIMKMAISSGVMDLNNIRNSYNSFAEGGPTEKPTFEEYYQSLPKDKRDTVNYNLRRAYELYPYEYMVKFAEDPNYHLGTVAYNEDTDEYEFLKGKNHNTVQKEIEWYYSNDSDAIEHRKNWKLDTSGDTYKYIRKNKFYTGGSTEEPKGDILGIPVPQEVETAASFVPILGTLMDAKEFIEDPSWENAGYLGLSLVAEIPFLKGLKAIKSAKAAKLMNKYDDAVKAYNKAEAKVKRMENTPNLNYKKINQARHDLFKAYSDMHNLDPKFRGPVHEALNVVDNIGDFQKVVDPLLLGMDAVANYSQLTKE
jgi:hypothetical protein